MKMVERLCLMSCALLFFLSSSQVFSLSTARMDINQIINESQAIIEGTVSRIDVGFDENDLISTFITFKDIYSHHGSVGDTNYIAVFTGGRYRGAGLSTGLVPKLDEGDRVILFLSDVNIDTPLVHPTNGIYLIGAMSNDSRPLLSTDGLLGACRV